MRTQITFNANEIKGSRAFLAVDVENACRSPYPTSAAARVLARQIADVFDRPANLAVVASSPNNAMVSHLVAMSCGGALKWRRGRNGADFALIDALYEVPQLNRRNPDYPISHVRLFSGDGIFIDPIASLQHHGIHVTVVSHVDTLHARLAARANSVIYLDYDLPLPQAA